MRVRLDSEDLCADADGHQVASAPATMLTQMRGNSHLLVLKELRQQRQVLERPSEAGPSLRAVRALFTLCSRGVFGLQA